MDGGRFRILFVCHANVCRSPMAERLMRRGFRDRLGPDDAAFRVRSAGTHARVNQPMHPLAAEVLQESGADPTAFRSRRLTGGLVAGADLVLTATRQQRSACVAFQPDAVRRTFTIRQFGRYAAATSTDRLVTPGTPPERLRSFVEQLSLIRSELPIATVDQDDLADPVDQPIEAFRRCGMEIEQIIDVTTALIAPIPLAARPPNPGLADPR